MALRFPSHAASHAAMLPAKAKKSGSHGANHNNSNSAAMRQSPQALIEARLSKTKMCKYMIQGMCTKGGECKFAHTMVELQQVPDLSCTKLCKTFMKMGRCDMVGCSYAHSKDDLRATDEFHKTKLCRFWPLGTCELGAKCRFAHANAELRPGMEGEKSGKGG